MATDFGRLVTAMVTPFDERLQVNWDRLPELVDYLIEEQKTDSIVVCGTTGESPTLSDEEKVRLYETCVRLARGRCRILAGTGTYDTEHSIHLTREAERAGVDGALVVVPYYSRPSQEGLYRHFSAIARSTSLPLMLYNIPSRTGVMLEAETTLRLAEFPNIVATKESHGDFDHLTRLIKAAPAGFRVYSGDDGLTLPFLAIGAYGVVSVAAHLVGRDIKRMMEAYADGRTAEAAQLHAKLHPVFHGMFFCPHRVPSPAPVKHALRLKGIDVGGVRLPLVPVTEQEAAFIARLVEQI
ncbi:MAG: 4-hydroxy-tetrahydrodipicolinate synthase [Candidatus Reconcilbacillus cellulovorans]|uniref:4-hydroxy-tetrahydrodipicolinate synthase n=1 Tax=Candidatus Reconcilbacillus cellulovorans TaxID=1906605 RepID=A0A2A6E0S5_9BACL|nr:MAG: 4-hydroxy-tetrahydrodipicolinate synthase [Candidatus Reconcilbacillus cellulovorans]